MRKPLDTAETADKDAKTGMLYPKIERGGEGWLRCPKIHEFYEAKSKILILE